MMGRQMRGPGWGLRANTGVGLRGPTGVGFVWGMADVCGARRILGTAPWVGPLQMRDPVMPGSPQQHRQLFRTLREWEVAPRTAGVWLPVSPQSAVWAAGRGMATLQRDPLQGHSLPYAFI